MKIDRVTVGYSELRSEGHPTYGNKKHSLELSACPERGETPESVRVRLVSLCKQLVMAELGDHAIDDPMNTADLPF